MTEKHQCSESVYRGLGLEPCRKPAKVQAPDGRWWCAIHDPARVAAKKAARDARWEAEETALAAKKAARDALWEAEETALAAKKAARDARWEAEKTARQNAYAAVVKIARTFTVAGYPAVADRNIWGDTVVRLDVDAACRLAERLTAKRLTE